MEEVKKKEDLTNVFTEGTKNKKLENRKQRRLKIQPIHHAIFTKKYKNERCRKTAWRNFLGEKEYRDFMKIKKQLKKESKK